MDVVSAKTSFFEGITLSFCPCGYAQPPEGDKPSPLIELTPFPPLQRRWRWRGGKGYLSILLLSSLSRGLKPTVTRVASLRDAFLLLSLSIFARKFCVHPSIFQYSLCPVDKTAQFGMINSNVKETEQFCLRVSIKFCTGHLKWRP